MTDCLLSWVLRSQPLCWARPKPALKVNYTKTILTFFLLYRLVSGSLVITALMFVVVDFYVILELLFTSLVVPALKVSSVTKMKAYLFLGVVQLGPLLPNELRKVSQGQIFKS